MEEPNHLEKWKPNLLKYKYFKETVEKVKELRAKGPVLPEPNQVFNAFKLTPIDKLKVVIVGQDPYPTKGHAHGLAFSCLGDRPASLQNIFKELYKDVYREDITWEEFNKHRPTDLTDWAEQGVLLLNRSLTLDEGQPNSHENVWKGFTNFVIKLLNAYPTPLVFMLWGRNAQELCQFITNGKHLVLTSAHPSPLSYDKGFSGNEHFRQATQFLIREDFIRLTDAMDFNRAIEIIHKEEDENCKKVTKEQLRELFERSFYPAIKKSSLTVNDLPINWIRP